jgi:hypothetical protein
VPNNHPKNGSFRYNITTKKTVKKKAEKKKTVFQTLLHTINAPIRLKEIAIFYLFWSLILI